MKNLIVAASTILAIGMTLTIHPALAQDGAGTYEMAESGIVIEFKMAPEEIAAEDGKKIKPNIDWKVNKKVTQKRVKVFEMAESGQTVTFPMTPDEAVAEDAENAILANSRKEEAHKQKANAIKYELAESGITVEFPLETPADSHVEAKAEKIFLEDLKI